MWTSRSEKLSDAHGLRFALDLDSRPATLAEVLRGWLDDEKFRSLFNSLLADAPFSAFHWETPAATTTTVVLPFEFVLLDSPGLAQRPDAGAFAEHFRRAKAQVVSFPNLGGDALLVVPCPVADPTAYGHMAAFARLAPAEQQQTLWRMVGEVMSSRLGDKPVWLSTAGAGVSWLHVRLDDKPKYYGYGPYRKAPLSQ
jgi:hypothetical protein